MKASAAVAAVEAVKENPGGKTYLDLYARDLVDAAVGVVTGALFVRYASRFPEKAPVLEYWLASKYPVLRGALARAKSGYDGAVSKFAEIAPAVKSE